MSFSLCLVSLIPVVERDGQFLTLDQWVMDLEVQLLQVSRLRLVNRVVPSPPPDWKQALPLPAGIEVVAIDGLDDAAAQDAVRGFDVVQIPSNQTWRELRQPRRLQRAARRLGCKVVVAISSNRARTVIMNAASQNLLRRMRARWRALDITVTLKRMSADADGACGVGEGLRMLFSARCPSVHVGMASWIRRAQMQGVAAMHEPAAFARRAGKLCTASRLERMKGLHLAIDAFAQRLSAAPQRAFELAILGEGPERAALERQAVEAGVAGPVYFTGKLNYADAFPAELRRHEMVLFANINDEQPRAVFDAIASGCIPICPRIPSYEVMGLPAELYYLRGDSAALADAVLRVDAIADKTNLLARLRQVGERFTFEAMHEQRAQWIAHTVLGRAPDAA